MSEGVTCLLNLAFGFIRTYGAEKLQDGDVVDNKFRGWIVDDLDDIKSKLDAISRKDLRTSISRLQKGVERLNMSFGESSFGESSFGESGNSSTSELPSAGATETKPAQQSVTVEDAVALASAIGKMKIASSERFQLAKESFKQAEKKACKAFHNAALSTEERILACKVGIASGILEHLEDPEVAASDCLQYLKELHDMPAIQEIFSVHVRGGIKSLFKKDSRTEIVETVTMINLILADFISKFTKRRMAVFDWPMIKCGKQVVHPIHYDKESLPNLKKMEITPPWDIVVIQDDHETCALNKRGDLICVTDARRGLQKLDKTTGSLQPYGLSHLEDNTKHPQPNGKVIHIAIDKDDTVYVLSGDEEIGYTLSVYSADGRNTHHCSLEFLQGRRTDMCHVAITNEKHIVLCFRSCSPLKEITVFVCNNEGELINSFDTGLKDNHEIESVSVSCNDGIILATFKWSHVVKHSNVLHIFTKDGKLQRTVKFHPSEGSDHYGGIFYQQVSKNIIGYVKHYGEGKILIECLSYQTAELQCSYLLYTTILPDTIYSSRLVCHTNGALAIVGHGHVILLQRPSL